MWVFSIRFICVTHLAPWIGGWILVFFGKFVQLYIMSIPVTPCPKHLAFPEYRQVSKCCYTSVWTNFHRWQYRVIWLACFRWDSWTQTHLFRWPSRLEQERKGESLASSPAWAITELPVAMATWGLSVSSACAAGARSARDSLSRVV